MGATGTFSISVEAIQADYLKQSVQAGASDTYKVSEIVSMWSSVVDGTYTPST